MAVLFGRTLKAEKTDRILTGTFCLPVCHPRVEGEVAIDDRLVDVVADASGSPTRALGSTSPRAQMLVGLHAPLPHPSKSGGPPDH